MRSLTTMSFAILTVFVLKAQAEILHCEVHGIKNRPDLENAVIQVDLETFNTDLTPNGGATIPLITSDQVSQFGAPRASCGYKYEELRHAKGGSVYEFAHKFSNCRPASGGLVFAQTRINIEKNAGAYGEVLVNGPPQTFSFPFSNCVRISLAR
jgi:hypothetical protein